MLVEQGAFSFANSNRVHIFVRFSISENGWTDSKISFEWAKDFEAITRAKADNGKRTRVLYMDGHKSHFSPQLLDYLEKHNVKVLGYPPHCTHILQGLDVGFFGQMKVVWKKHVHAWQQLNKQEMGKPGYAQVFGSAFQIVSSFPETIINSFARTGIQPFNPKAITPAQLLPSAATSTRASFPAPQRPEVFAVMKTWKGYRWTTTQDDLDPTHFADILTNPGSRSSPIPTPDPTQIQSATVDNVNVPNESRESANSPVVIQDEPSPPEEQDASCTNEASTSSPAGTSGLSPPSTSNCDLRAPKPVSLPYHFDTSIPNMSWSPTCKR
jgi:hypothetical protein